MLRDPLQAASTICITMRFAKLFVHALLAVAFVQTGSALVQGEYEETGQCEVLLVLVVKNIQCFGYYAWHRENHFMLNSKLLRTGKQNGIEVRTHCMTYFTLKDTESSRHVGLQRDGITSISCRDCIETLGMPIQED